MRILCNEEGVLSESMMNTLERAAVLCTEKEGLYPENIEVSLTFVDKEEIHRLNMMYRQVDNPTDVLSFPLIEDFNEVDIESEELMLGDVVICIEKVKEQAAEYGHTEERETVYLFVHSILHLLGYDHMEDEDKKEMRAREEEIMNLLDIRRGE